MLTVIPFQSRSGRLLFALLALLVATPLAAWAQTSDSIEEGKEAFREERYEAAARAFERAAEADPQNAEAHYLLARVYFETPLRDAKKAERAIDRALALEPNNVQFLVARLQQLRTESWNFFVERIKEAKRRELAREILVLDSTNAFAHEELGLSNIRDFWRYRNAIMLPNLGGPTAYVDDDEVANPLEERGIEAGTVGPSAISGGADEDGAAVPFGASLNPNEVFLADRFDVETLRAQGVPVQSLAGRAQRAYDRAIGHLEQALASDPRRRSVYDALMGIYALKGEYGAALEMLEQMYVHFPEDPTTWSYLGLAHERTGNEDAADRSFQTAFQFMTPEEKQAYEGLRDLLPENEKKRYEDEPVAYASRFWTSKDPRYLTPYNERKLEHWARLTYADLLYGAPDLDLRGWNTQRGQILVRYGLPQADVTIVPGSTPITTRRAISRVLQTTTTEVDEDGNATAVRTGEDPEVTTVATGAALDMFEEANTYNVWDYGDFRFVFEDPFRNGEYRLYSPSASDISAGTDAWINDYEIRARETFREVPERYIYEAPGRQIEIPYLISTFRGEGDLADLYVHYGIPIVEYNPDQRQIDVTANTGTFLISDERDILAEQRRTIYGLRTSQIIPFDETNLWVDTKVMRAPPGTHEVSVEFETASQATVAVQRREVDVPDYAADRLALSDVMLAYHIEETENDEPLGDADVVRRGLSIRPAPWTVFSVRQPVYLYFEAYNLQLGSDGQSDYTVEISLVPKETAKGITKVFKGLFGGDEGVSVRYPGSSATPDPSEYQILDATDQPPGLYTLTVRVRDNLAGEAEETQQDLFLEE